MFHFSINSHNTLINQWLSVIIISQHITISTHSINFTLPFIISFLLSSLAGFFFLSPFYWLKCLFFSFKIPIISSFLFHLSNIQSIFLHFLSLTACTITAASYFFSLAECSFHIFLVPNSHHVDHSVMSLSLIIGHMIDQETRLIFIVKWFFLQDPLFLVMTHLQIWTFQQVTIPLGISYLSMLASKFYSWRAISLLIEWLSRTYIFLKIRDLNNQNHSDRRGYFSESSSHVRQIEKEWKR